MPLGVKIISILHYIAAAFTVLASLILILSAGAVGSAIPFFGAIGGLMLGAAAVFMIGLAVLVFFIGRGLWKGQNWARIVAIVFGCLGMIRATFGIADNPSYVATLVIYVLIVGYLAFSPKVKKIFA